LSFERQVAVRVIYKAVPIGDGCKADIVVARQLILEGKAVAGILPAHEAQLHTYLRMGGLRIGLLLNFNAVRLVDGLRRYVV
jgi:GxxExxY protein